MVLLLPSFSFTCKVWLIVMVVFSSLHVRCYLSICRSTSYCSGQSFGQASNATARGSNTEIREGKIDFAAQVYLSYQVFCCGSAIVLGIRVRMADDPVVDMPEIDLLSGLCTHRRLLVHNDVLALPHWRAHLSSLRLSSLVFAGPLAWQLP